MLNKLFEKKEKIEVKFVSFECPESLIEFLPKEEEVEVFKQHITQVVQLHNDKVDGINN